MAGTSIRKSVAEPDHVLFGVPIITYLAFAIFPIGAFFTVAGFDQGLMIGLAVSAAIHIFSIIMRIRQPFMENLIWYWITKKSLGDVFQKRNRSFLR